MKVRLIAASMAGLLACSAASHAACWRAPNGQYFETASISTPPVQGASRVTCSAVPASVQLRPASPSSVSLSKYPVDGSITQRFGVPWSENAAKTHTGVDIAAKKGVSVPAMAEGTVTHISDMGGTWGKGVVVTEANGTAKAYLHVRPSVSKGDTVVRGKSIGTVWKDHLHYSVCKRAQFCERGALPTTKPDPHYPSDPLFKDGPFIAP